MSAKQLIEVRASHESICLRYRIDHSIQRLYFLVNALSPARDIGQVGKYRDVPRLLNLVYKGLQVYLEMFRRYLPKRIICSPLQEPIMDVRVKREPGIHILSSTIGIPSSHTAIKYCRETLGKHSMNILCKVRLLVIKAAKCHPGNGISREKECIIEAGRNVMQLNLIHENIRLRGLWLSLRYGHLHP